MTSGDWFFHLSRVMIGIALSLVPLRLTVAYPETLPRPQGDAAYAWSVPVPVTTGQTYSSAISLFQRAAHVQSGGTSPILPGMSLYNVPTFYIQDPSAIFLLARIEKKDAKAVIVGGDMYSAGTLSLMTVEVLGSKPLKPGEEISLPFHQRRRNLKREQDNWNNLDLSKANLLLLVCKSPDGGRHWEAVSGNNVSSSQDPQVDTVRRAFQIQAAPSVQAKEMKLNEALYGSNDDLADYVTGVLTSGELLGPSESARVLALALSSPAMPRERLSRLAFLSMNWFTDEPAADLRAGVPLVAAIARLMVQAISEKERAEFADALVWASVHCSSHAAYSTVVASVHDPAATAMEAELKRVIAHTSTRDRAPLTALLQLWKESHPEPRR